MNVKVASDSIANNIVMQALGRISSIATLPAVGLILYLGGQWLDQRFAAQASAIADLAASVKVLQATVGTNSERVVRLETSNTDQVDAQRQILDRLNEMERSIMPLSNSVAALNATLASRTHRISE